MTTSTRKPTPDPPTHTRVAELEAQVDFWRESARKEYECRVRCAETSHLRAQALFDLRMIAKKIEERWLTQERFDGEDAHHIRAIFRDINRLGEYAIR